jgi:hypothetical protein
LSLKNYEIVAKQEGQNGANAGFTLKNRQDKGGGERLGIGAIYLLLGL